MTGLLDGFSHLSDRHGESYINFMAQKLFKTCLHRLGTGWKD